jgi:putative ABC transport system permease protein
MGITVRSGRGIEPRDREGAPLALVVNQAFARAHFAGTDAVGKRLVTGSREKPNFWEIVGVADDVRFFGPDQAQTPAVYLPLAQRPARSFYVALRTRGEPTALLAATRRAIAELDPGLAAGNPATMEQRRDDAMRSQRLVATLVGAFSVLALTLAAVGVYGVAAFSVAQRLREFGVRMALGASRRTLIELVLSNAVKLAAVGVVIGLVLAAALGRALASLLFEVQPDDPAVFAGVCALLLVVALVATLAPALRASRVNPTVALRHE